MLSYFERELASIRSALSDYGRDFPQHAGSMRLNQHDQEDPNISRLIEAAALLNAKTEKRLDEQFPEILQDLINIVYPGYLQIIPSYTPFYLDVEAEEATTKVVLNKGSELSVVHDEVESIFTLVDEMVIEPFTSRISQQQRLLSTFQRRQPCDVQIRRFKLSFQVMTQSYFSHKWTSARSIFM